MMAITPIGTPPPAPRPLETESRSTPVEQAANARSQQNLAILLASQQVSLSVGNQPLALVFTAAIDAINQALEPTLGANAIERTQQSRLDVSPEATAERIVSLTTGLFSRFQAQRPELGEPEQVERFLELITEGIETGFAEAREILDGLGVLEGEVASNIDRTFDLVQEGLQVFRDRVLGVGEAEPGEA